MLALLPPVVVTRKAHSVRGARGIALSAWRVSSEGAILTAQSHSAAVLPCAIRYALCA